MSTDVWLVKEIYFTLMMRTVFKNASKVCNFYKLLWSFTVKCWYNNMLNRCWESVYSLILCIVIEYWVAYLMLAYSVETCHMISCKLITLLFFDSLWLLWKYGRVEIFGSKTKQCFTKKFRASSVQRVLGTIQFRIFCLSTYSVKM